MDPLTRGASIILASLALSLLLPGVVEQVLRSLNPFIYGGIGALAYLLGSCHERLHKRDFDPNHIPEYVSRIFLGVVSGGTIFLFVDKVGDGDTQIQLAPAALAFLAGYNNDFLFVTIERVVAAILPKVGLESVRRAPASAAETVSETMKALIEARAKADNDEERKRLDALIETVAGRL